MRWAPVQGNSLDCTAICGRQAQQAKCFTISTPADSACLKAAGVLQAAASRPAGNTTRTSAEKARWRAPYIVDVHDSVCAVHEPIIELLPPKLWLPEAGCKVLQVCQAPAKEHCACTGAACD